MIYILLANGASVIPQFVPYIPQLILLLWAFFVFVTYRHRVALPLYGIVCFLFVLSFAAFLYGEYNEGYRFLKLFFNCLVAMLLATGIRQRYEENFSEAYSEAVLLFTVLGIIGLILTSFSSWSAVSSIGDRVYHTNFLTTWLMDGDFDSSHTLFSPFPYRLQSMFDEPGTYGMLLVPAFFYFFFSSRFLGAAILLMGVFLSESANAWVLCVLVMILKAIQLDRIKAKVFLGIMMLLVTTVFWSVFIQLYEIKTGIDAAYVHNSSVGVRSDEYAYVFNSWAYHVLPFDDMKVESRFPDGISVSYINWYVKSGFGFLIVLCLVFWRFCMKLMVNFKTGTHDGWFPIVLGATLLLSGFQRSSFLDNILFMTLTFWAIFYSDINKRAKLVYESA